MNVEMIKRAFLRLPSIRRNCAYFVHARHLGGLGGQDPCERDFELTEENKESPFESSSKDEAGVQPNLDVELSMVSDGVHNTNSVILSSRPKSYIFNMGEGFQLGAYYGRATKGHQFTLQNIFVTHCSWKNLGGLQGYLQTDRCGKLDHQLHGPVDYKKFLDSVRRTATIVLEKGGYDFKILGKWHSYFEDDQVRIEYVKLRGKTTPADEENPRLVYAYIIKPKRCEKVLSTTNFSPEKLVELNIKWGPMTDALKAGKKVTLKNGKVIRLKDVLEDNTHKYARGSIVILECPSEEYLDSLLAAPEFVALKKDPEWEPDLIVHMSPVEVTKEKRYNAFVNRFRGRTVHLLLNEKSRGYFCPMYHVYRRSLTEWNPHLFPPLLQGPRVDNFTRPKPGQAVQGFAGQIYNYRRQKWAIPIPEGRIMYRPVKPKHIDSKYKCKPVNHNEFPEVVFLGTGSSQPQTFRNVMGILVQMRRNEYMMLDCGENTLRQMNRLYGKDSSAVLRNLKAVFISHKHFDHLGGLPSILAEWNRVTKGLVPAPDLQLLVPIEMKEFLELQETMLGQDLSRVKIMYHNPLFAWKKKKQKPNPAHIQEMETIQNNLGLSQLLPVMVPHQKWFKAYGLVMNHRDGWKLVYTGDTSKNCRDLIRHGENCDILIHEATFPRHLWRHAGNCGHSTTSHAMENAEAMNAKYTLMTHFSYSLQCLESTKNVGVSFDLMKFRPSQAEELSGILLNTVPLAQRRESPKLVERQTMRDSDWDVGLPSSSNNKKTRR